MRFSTVLVLYLVYRFTITTRKNTETSFVDVTIHNLAIITRVQDGWLPYQPAICIFKSGSLQNDYDCILVAWLQSQTLNSYQMLVAGNINIQVAELQQVVQFAEIGNSSY